MSEADIVFQIYVVIVAVELLVIFVAYGLWVALHGVLSKGLDPILLREPYFTKAEQINCLVWPLSFLKSLNYIGLITAPRVAKRKRFRGFDKELPVGRRLRMVCKVQFTFMLLLVVVGIVFLATWALRL